MCTADIKNHFLECKIEETAININYSKAITHISHEMNNSVMYFDFDKRITSNYLNLHLLPDKLFERVR